LLTELKIADLNVKLICCDDAGEIRSRKEDLKVKYFGVRFDFSGPRTLKLRGSFRRFTEGFVQC
jgi:hypothetical protein